jgi:hypothetical protein
MSCGPSVRHRTEITKFLAPQVGLAAHAADLSDQHTSPEKAISVGLLPPPGGSHVDFVFPNGIGDSRLTLVAEDSREPVPAA